MTTAPLHLDVEASNELAGWTSGPALLLRRPYVLITAMIVTVLIVVGLKLNAIVPKTSHQALASTLTTHLAFAPSPLALRGPSAKLGGMGELGARFHTTERYIYKEAGKERTSSPTMLFGGGGDKDKPKQPGMMEMMKKASEMGGKMQELTKELQATEIEAVAADGGVTVTVSGTQMPISTKITEEFLAKGTDAVSEAVTLAQQQAHARSLQYSTEKMGELYKEIGLPVPPGPDGLGAPPGGGLPR